MEIISTSPGGSFQVQVKVWEARNSLWVYRPGIWDAGRKLHILSFKDETWSVDESTWIGEAKVLLLLRKFPGYHRPEELKVEIDGIAQLALVFCCNTDRVGRSRVCAGPGACLGEMREQMLRRIERMRRDAYWASAAG